MLHEFHASSSTGDMPTSRDHDSEESNADMQRIEKALEVLSEHFDTVQIFCTRYDSGEENGTVNISRGVSHWFARYGQVCDWVHRCNEEIRIEARESMRE